VKLRMDNQSAVHRIKNYSVFIIGLICFFSLSQPAYATKKVYSPHIEAGELELEARGSVDYDSRDSKNDKQKQKYAIGYGFTNWWFTEIYGEIEKGAGEGAFEFTATEWENRFQLTEPGQYWVDVGLYVAYEASSEEDTDDKVEGKLLLEKSVGQSTHILNLILEKRVWADADEELEGGLAWGSRYRWREYLEPGLEFHSDFGVLNEGLSFSEQTHQAGPVVYGKIGHVKYDIGYLFGVTDAAPEGSLKWIMEYEWKF